MRGDSWRHGPRILISRSPASTRCVRSGTVSEPAVAHGSRRSVTRSRFRRDVRSSKPWLKREPARADRDFLPTRQRRVACVPERRTKIVATIGPAQAAPGALERLLDSGVDVLRVNLSHATPREQAAQVRRARAHRPDIAVLADLGGPKLRLGELSRRHQGVGGRHDHARRGRHPARRSVAVRPGARGRSRLRRGRDDRARRHRRAARLRGLPRSRRRHAALAQGHQPAERHVVAARADRQGPRRSGGHRGPRAGLHRHLVRAARAGSRRSRAS